MITKILALFIVAFTAFITPAVHAATIPRQYFGLVAPANTGAFPRSDTYCAPRVQFFGERVPANTTPNHTVIPWYTNLHFGPWINQTPEMRANFLRVTGHFAGTTDEVIEWAACKWGLDQNIIKAEAIAESDWRQSELGDYGCGHYDSFGIIQVRATNASNCSGYNTGWGGYPYTARSTAADLDAYGAYIRTVYDGRSYMGTATRGHIWAAVSSWQSGYNSGLDWYVKEVQTYLAQKAWLKI